MTAPQARVVPPCGCISFESQPISHAGGGLGADAVDVLQIGRTCERGGSARFLVDTLAIGDNRPGSCQSHSRQTSQAGHGGRIGVNPRRQLPARYLRSGRQRQHQTRPNRHRQNDSDEETARLRNASAKRLLRYAMVRRHDSPAICSDSTELLYRFDTARCNRLSDSNASLEASDSVSKPLWATAQPSPSARLP